LALTNRPVLVISVSAPPELLVQPTIPKTTLHTQGLSKTIYKRVQALGPTAVVKENSNLNALHILSQKEEAEIHAMKGS